MPDTCSTNAVQIFVESARAIRAGIEMVPRSRNDKEYFPQDWFIDRLTSLELPYEQQGRNSYPDFWVGGDPKIEGYEIKSLAFANGKPARKDYDSNSTIPSGRKSNRDVFLVFFLYTGSGEANRTVHSLSIAHGDLINSDYEVADAHVNPAIREFGSYGDGFIRNRKMYVFPHPMSIDPDGIGRQRLVLPTEWKIRSTELARIGVIDRVVSRDAVDSYTIHLHRGGEVRVGKVPYKEGGKTRRFDVFELR